MRGVDVTAARTAKGVVGVLTGADLAADKLGGLICGWMITSKDGTPMKAGAHPALALDRVRYVGDHIAIVIAETQAQAKDAVHGAAQRLCVGSLAQADARHALSLTMKHASRRRFISS